MGGKESIFPSSSLTELLLTRSSSRPQISLYCVVTDNIHTTRTEGIEILGGRGGGGEVEGSQIPKNLKKCMKFKWNFQSDGGSYKKSLPWERYGYFMELHIAG